MRWVWRGSALAVLFVGWVFIAWQNHFHITAPVVFVCLAFLAVVATVYNLWRTGAAAVSTGDDEGDSTWAKPAGRLGELEREKRTLLKAIKEAEFDRDMGKLSQRDADDMIRGYRARAIEVIKEIDLHERGGVGTVREQILREIRARVELEGKAAKVRPGKAEPKIKADAKASAKPARPAAAGTASARAADPVAATPEPAASAEPAVEAAKPAVPRDEELDADSTTALEHGEPAKEATP